MRTLEAIVIIANVVVLARLMWMSRGLTKWNAGLAGAAGLLTALQLFTEGFRWQMVPAYLALPIIALLILIRPHRVSVSSSWKMRSVKGILLLLYTAAAVLPPILVPVFSFGKPTGPYEIGTATYYVRDDDREELYTDDPDDKRELVVQLWYPSRTGSTESKAPYVAHPAELAAGLSQTQGFPSFLFGHLGLVTTNARVEAAVSEQQDAWPLLIFSHGMGSYRNSSTFQFEELASNGYMIASIDHTYDAAATVLSNGRVAPSLTQIDAGLSLLDSHISLWVEDVQFVMDQLEELNGDHDSPFYNQMNMSQVGMFGHSYGGATAMQILMKDDRIKAAINLDGGLYGDLAPDTGVGKPFMLFNADETEKYFNDAHINESDFPEDTKEILIEISKRRESALTGGGYSVTIPGTNHMSFTDFNFFSSLLPSKTHDSLNYHSLTNEICLLFFDQYIKEDKKASMNRIVTKYPTINFKQH
ncbi:alpha/beta hydrolase family protein [Paenibacillus sp. NPDC057967]|uniref:alpha/beta hydrolase family protein n=1 Tax=Paenibacillus sp. NPDC057967 TaxID=3346293 RepID=UPI0036D7B0B7